LFVFFNEAAASIQPIAVPQKGIRQCWDTCRGRRLPVMVRSTRERKWYTGVEQRLAIYILGNGRTLKTLPRFLRYRIRSDAVALFRSARFESSDVLVLLPSVSDLSASAEMQGRLDCMGQHQSINFTYSSSEVMLSNSIFLVNDLFF
jgi:hypothetical protein